MPVVYQGQGGASLDPTSGTSTYIFSTSRSSSYSWFALSSPWLCGAVLIVAVLLYHHRRGKGKGSRGVSMSQAETPVSTNSPKQSQWSADDNSRSEKEAFSTSSSSWSPSVVKHGHHASGTPITTAVKTIFPYPAPPSPTLSPMADEDENRDFQDLESQVSPSALTSSTSQAGTREPPRRRSYTKSSLIPLSPQSTISMSSTREISPPGPERASTFPITADSSEFEFGTGADPLPMGIELNEEIIIAAEGWRRHTRVYGGGVCLACVESEQQADKMGIKLAEMDA